MNSFRRRLFHLESRPRRRPSATSILARMQGWYVPQEEYRRIVAVQRLCNLPLPADATKDERAECLRLLQAVQQRIRAGASDENILDAVRDYALALHRQYGTDPTWQE